MNTTKKTENAVAVLKKDGDWLEPMKSYAVSLLTVAETLDALQNLVRQKSLKSDIAKARKLIFGDMDIAGILDYPGTRAEQVEMVLESLYHPKLPLED